MTQKDGLHGKLPAFYCAIDTQDLEAACALVRTLPVDRVGIKCGLEFFSAHGADGVETLMREAENHASGVRPSLFLDLKFHDIPNTVAGAIRAVTHRLAPDYVNVHGSGGAEMMRAARGACALRTRLLAVTVLTSLDDAALARVGQETPVAAQAGRLAALALESGLDGVVCSPHEIAPLRARCGSQAVLMTPGVRPEGAAVQDQKRVMTPRAAMDLGATHLVIGRPVTQAADPSAAAHAILESLAS